MNLPEGVDSGPSGALPRRFTRAKGSGPPSVCPPDDEVDESAKKVRMRGRGKPSFESLKRSRRTGRTPFRDAGCVSDTVIAFDELPEELDVASRLEA